MCLTADHCAVSSATHSCPPRSAEVRAWLGRFHGTFESGRAHPEGAIDEHEWLDVVTKMCKALFDADEFDEVCLFVCLVCLFVREVTRRMRSGWLP